MSFILTFTKRTNVNIQNQLMNILRHYTNYEAKKLKTSFSFQIIIITYITIYNLEEMQCFMHTKVHQLRTCASRNVWKRGHHDGAAANHVAART